MRPITTLGWTVYGVGVVDDAWLSFASNGPSGSYDRQDPGDWSCFHFGSCS